MIHNPVPSQREPDSTKSGKPESKKARIDRSAFLYMEPRKLHEAWFAQCATCQMFVDTESLENGPRCVLHGSDQPIAATGSCGLFIKWPGVPASDSNYFHAAELDIGLKPSVTTKESGYVDRPVRCENCRHFDAEESDCELYEKLNKTLPDLFALNEKVNQYGCCNANTPK